MVAISAGPEGQLKSILPCGGCRQKLVEFASADAQVLIDGPGGVTAYALADLLPASFGAADLS